MSWRFDPQTEIEKMGGAPAILAIPAILGSPAARPEVKIAKIARIATPHPENHISPLGPAQARECFAWPVETQSLMVATMEGFEQEGHPVPQAEALAYATVKALMERHGGPVGLKDHPTPGAPELGSWPQEAVAEVQERAPRLVAGGWTPAQAQDLAACIVADQRGLTLSRQAQPRGDMPQVDMDAVFRLAQKILQGTKETFNGD